MHSYQRISVFPKMFPNVKNGDNIQGFLGWPMAPPGQRSGQHPRRWRCRWLGPCLCTVLGRTSTVHCPQKTWGILAIIGANLDTKIESAIVNIVNILSWFPCFKFIQCKHVHVYIYIYLYVYIYIYRCIFIYGFIWDVYVYLVCLNVFWYLFGVPWSHSKGREHCQLPGAQPHMAKAPAISRIVLWNWLQY